MPPPQGARDPYSAQTRVATQPEHVLEAMRARETDASLQQRTKSGTRAAVRPAVPPPLPPLAPILTLSIPTPGQWPSPIVVPEAAPVEAQEISRDLLLPALTPRNLRAELLRTLLMLGAFALLGALLAAVIALAMP